MRPQSAASPPRGPGAHRSSRVPAATWDALAESRTPADAAPPASPADCGWAIPGCRASPACRIVVASSVSRRRSSGLPWGVGSPLVRSSTPTRRPSAFNCRIRPACAEFRIVGMGSNHKAIEHRFLRVVHTGVAALQYTSLAAARVCRAAAIGRHPRVHGQNAGIHGLRLGVPEHDASGQGLSKRDACSTGWQLLWTKAVESGTFPRHSAGAILCSVGPCVPL